MAQCIVIGPVCGCVWVCYRDNSKLRASILTKLGLGKGCDHLQLIKFWLSGAPGKGSVAGRKFWLHYSQRTVFASPLSADFTLCSVYHLDRSGSGEEHPAWSWWWWSSCSWRSWHCWSCWCWRCWRPTWRGWWHPWNRHHRYNPCHTTRHYTSLFMSTE